MESNEPIIVHRVSIARIVEQGGSAVNIATCRLCKIVIERQKGPLLIKMPGLYLVNNIGTGNMDARIVEEPLDPGMKLCTESTE